MDVVEQNRGDRHRLTRLIAKGSDAMQRDRLRSVLLMLIKQQLLCESGVLEVVHLTSMVR